MLWWVSWLALHRIGVVRLSRPISMGSFLLLHVQPSLLSRKLKLRIIAKMARRLMPSVSHLLCLSSLLLLRNVRIWMHTTRIVLRVLFGTETSHPRLVQKLPTPSRRGRVVLLLLLWMMVMLLLLLLMVCIRLCRAWSLR